MRFTGDSAQPETAGIIITGRFHPAVIKQHHFAVRFFKKKLAVIAADKGIGNKVFHRPTIKAGTVEKQAFSQAQRVIHGSCPFPSLQGHQMRISGHLVDYHFINISFFRCFSIPAALSVVYQRGGFVATIRLSPHLTATTCRNNSGSLHINVQNLYVIKDRFN